MSAPHPIFDHLGREFGTQFPPEPTPEQPEPLLPTSAREWAAMALCYANIGAWAVAALGVSLVPAGALLALSGAFLAYDRLVPERTA